MVQKRHLIQSELFKEQWLSISTAIIINQTVFLQNNTVFPIPYVPNDSLIPGSYCFGISLMIEFIDGKMQSTKAAFVAKEERKRWVRHKRWVDQVVNISLMKFKVKFKNIAIYSIKYCA